MADEENAVTKLESLLAELRTDIFSRLDGKTLARFRCVSKPFSSFVSTPELISAHCLRSRKNPLLLFFIKSYESPRLVSLDTRTMTSSNISLQNREVSFQPDLTPVLTCLKLVCVHDKGNGICVFNPTNNYRKALPPSNTKSHPEGGERISLGFGYVRSTNQYKVVRIGTIYLYDYNDDDSFNGTLRYYGFTEVFTVGTDEKWRDIEKTPPSFLEHEHVSAAIVNESLYYLSKIDLVTISKFDLEREEWSMLPPLPFAPNSTNRLLKELGGNLCLVTQTEPDSLFIDLWILKDFDTYSWAKVYHIDISSLVEYIYSHSGIAAYPLKIEEDGRLLLFLRFSEAKLAYYDPKNGDFEDINLSEKLSLGYNDRVSATPTLYVDSLSSFDD